MNSGNTNSGGRELGLEERRSRIIQILSEKGKVKVSELSRLFNISEVSIRNDLAELERIGALERVHGGAVSTVRAYYSMSFNERAATNAEEKKKIAAEAAKLIKDGDSVMFNPGTTSLFVARELKNHKDIKIVTNSVAIASEIGFYGNIQVILLGGSYNPRYYFIYGDDAINQLKKYKANRLILSVDGVCPDEGITTYLHQEAELMKQMIDRANSTIVVADFSKVGRVSFSSIAPMEKVDVLITDSKANGDTLEAIREKGVEVIVV